MPFAKGNRANPNGRPKKGQALTDLLRLRMAEPGPDGRLNSEIVADKLIALACAGEMDAIKVVFDRLDGKVATPVDLQGEQRINIVLDWGDGGGS